MPQKLVEVPGMSDPVEFPDSMSDDAIATVLRGYHQASNPTSDASMAQANVGLAVRGVPRPANPIDQAQPSTLFDPRLQQGARIAADLVSRNVKQGAQSLWDTSLGSIPLAIQRGTGPAVTPEQQEASARLKGAAKNAVLNYAGGMVGEELSPTRPFTQGPNPMVPKLLNASGQVNPETLANLQAAEPALRAGGAPSKLTQAGMAEHARNLSKGIDAQIAPVIQANAAKDVSASTAQIANNLRSQITPEMQGVNSGTANAVNKLADSIENSKTLGSLDELRGQLNDRVYAVKPNAVFRPYVKSALNDVLDTIANHAQQVRPDLPVRSMRSQQSALMKLADTFDESAATGRTQAASQAGLTARQKAGQVLPDILQAAMNPKAALAKKLVQPATSEQLIQQAFKGQPQSAAGSLVRSVAPESGMSSLDMENMTRGGNPAEQAQIQQEIQRAQDRPRIGFNTTGVDPNAPPPEIMQAVRQARPDLFTGQSAPMGTETASGAGFDNNVLNSVRSEHPDWSLSQQLQEAANRANRARGR